MGNEKTELYGNKSYIIYSKKQDLFIITIVFNPGTNYSLGKLERAG